MEFIEIEPFSDDNVLFSGYEGIVSVQKNITGYKLVDIDHLLKAKAGDNGLDYVPFETKRLDKVILKEIEEAIVSPYFKSIINYYYELPCGIRLNNELIVSLAQDPNSTCMENFGDNASALAVVSPLQLPVEDADLDSYFGDNYIGLNEFIGELKQSINEVDTYLSSFCGDISVKKIGTI